jgi:hypothetical protein
MRKSINTIVILLAVSAACAGQEKSVRPAPGAAPSVSGQQGPSVPQPTSEQQREFAEAVRQTQEANKDMEAAEARLEAARARAQASLFRVMATLKLSPEEYRAVLTNEGRLTFEKIPTPKQ